MHDWDSEPLEGLLKSREQWTRRPIDNFEGAWCSSVFFLLLAILVFAFRGLFASCYRASLECKKSKNTQSNMTHRYCTVLMTVGGRPSWTMFFVFVVRCSLSACNPNSELRMLHAIARSEKDKSWIIEILTVVWISINYNVPVGDTAK